jgi:hypothetical protein
MNNEQKQKTMKIEAQNLTVGMDIKWGYIAYKITKLENTTLKNGKPAIKVFGTYHEHVVGKGKYRRTIPAGKKPQKLKIFHASTAVALA